MVGLVCSGGRGCEGAGVGFQGDWKGAVREVAREARGRERLIRNGGNCACTMGRLDAAPKSNTASATAIAIANVQGSLLVPPATATATATASATATAATTVTATATATATNIATAAAAASGAGTASMMCRKKKIYRKYKDFRQDFVCKQEMMTA